MGLYSVTEAINHMLLTSGEHLVNDLDDEAGVDTSVARFIFKQTIKAAIMRGIANNRFVDEYSPEVGGVNDTRILLPSTACYAQVVEPLFDSTTGEVIQTTLKSNPSRLFNITKQTDDFSEYDSLKIEVIIMLGAEVDYYGWDDIDSALQRGIMESAAREYQMITQGDLDIDKRLAVRESYHMSKGRAGDIFKKNRSIFYGDPGTRAAVDRRGILSNDPYFTRTRF
jgi:hypothetical protein